MINNRVNLMKDELYNTAKGFIGGGLPVLGVGGKTCSVSRIVEAHEALFSKVGSKSFMEALTFSIKVLLPTHLNNPTLFMLYTKLFEAKLSKKLILLLKKEANGLNPRDVRTVQEFTKTLAEEELHYSRKNSASISGNNPALNSEKEIFHLRVAELVEKVEHLTIEIK